jgi:predicted nucleic acid-binding protein
VVALLDSVAVAAFLDRDDVFHAAADARIRELAGRDALIVSVITYAELLTGAALGHHAGPVVRGFFRDLVDEVHPVDRAVAERAAELRAARTSLRLPDALILATADLRKADVVITGDRHWTNVDGGARVELLGSSGA